MEVTLISFAILIQAKSTLFLKALVLFLLGNYCAFFGLLHKKTQEVSYKTISKMLFAHKWLVTNILALSKGEEYNQPTSSYMSCGDTYPQ